MAGATLVSMKNAEFEPVNMQVASGDARLVVKNGDLGVHTFTIDELEVDVTVLGGSEKLVTLPSSAKGTYE